MQQKQYTIFLQDGKKYVRMYLSSNDFVSVTKDEDEVCALHIGAATIEFEADEIELARTL